MFPILPELTERIGAPVYRLRPFVGHLLKSEDVSLHQHGCLLSVASHGFNFQTALLSISL